MSGLSALIFNIQKFSTEDGPGIRTTVFFKGCPMRCPWCHNPESLSHRPEAVWHQGRCLNDRGCLKACTTEALHFGANGLEFDRERCTGCGQCAEFCPSQAIELHGRAVPVDELARQVLRDGAFYRASEGGVTLSGGEPLAQPHAALELMRILRAAGIHVALDTCGAAADWALEEALAALDLVLLDLKTVDPQQHEALTGVPFNVVAASARRIAEAGVPLWVRTPVIPGYTADEASVRAVARFVARELPNCQRHDLLAFSNLCVSKYRQLGRPFALEGVPLLEAATMERLCAAAREAGSQFAQWSGPTRVQKGA